MSSSVKIDRNASRYAANNAEPSGKIWEEVLLAIRDAAWAGRYEARFTQHHYDPIIIRELERREFIVIGTTPVQSFLTGKSFIVKW